MINWKIISSIIFLSAVFVYYLYRIKQIQKNPDSHYNKKVTKFGYLIYTIMIIVMLGIFSLEHTAPNSILGKVVASNEGRFFVAIVIAAVFAVIAHLLRKRGLKALSDNKDNV